MAVHYRPSQPTSLPTFPSTTAPSPAPFPSTSHTMARPDRSSPVLFAPQPAHFTSRPLLSQSFSSPSFPTAGTGPSSSGLQIPPPPPVHHSSGLPLHHHHAHAPLSLPSSPAFASPLSSASSTPPPVISTPAFTPSAPVPAPAHTLATQPPLLKPAFSLSPSSSSSGKPRPKLPKKGSSSCSKARAVQCSLEIKVERAKGFHAFFVPLARNLPPPPPSSPVAGVSAREEKGDYFVPVGVNAGAPGTGVGAALGFMGKGQVIEERWVEDVQVDDGMEIDSPQ